MKRGVKIERGIQSWIRKYEIPNSEYRLNDEQKETKTYQHYIPIVQNSERGWAEVLIDNK